MVSIVTTDLKCVEACRNYTKPLRNFQKASMKAAAQGTCMALASDDHILTHTAKTMTNLTLPKEAQICPASV
jgi:hypothetical protein